MKHALLAIALVALLPACRGGDPQAAAQAAAAQAAAQERAAEDMARQFDDAVAAQNWHLAKGYGEVLQIEHPSSAAAARIQPLLGDIKVQPEPATPAGVRTQPAPTRPRTPESRAMKP